MNSELIFLFSNFVTLIFILVLVVGVWSSWQYTRSVNLAKKEGRPRPPYPLKKVVAILLALTILHILGTWLRAKQFDLEVSKILEQ